ncbi:MAG: dihydroxyacetone kinase subunit L [Anaerolineaceae bacterium]|nr:dihydroxyacetone kinase subunit L [Anaerolineaceae bacterium]
MTDKLNLNTVFEEVTKVLAINRQQLDNADDYNQNHGTNMVHTFGLIQKAVASKQDEPASEQLSYASKVLKEQSTGGTARIYADGLARASQEFSGKEFNANTVGTLINAMMGLDTGTQQGGGDFLSSLLSSLGSQQTGQPQAGSQQESGSLLGGLLGSLTGSASSQPGSENNLSGLLGGLLSGQSGGSHVSGNQPSEPGSKDLLSLGLAYLAAKQGGQSNLQAIMQALGSASPLGKRQDQQQSGALVISTILNMLGNR